MIHIIHHLIDFIISFDYHSIINPTNLLAASAGCIIIHKPEGIKLDEIVYRNSFNRNDHGAGMCFVDNNKLVIIKGMNTVDEMLYEVKKHEEKELLIHYRLMSKGKISDENCHPFFIPGANFPKYEFAVMHNGTLNHRSTIDKSDTNCFVEDVLSPMLDRDPYFFDHQIGMLMMQSFITSQNKFAIMRHNSKDKESDVYIVNRKEGIMYNGCWFSNMSFTDDNSRYIGINDGERMKNWKPKLYIEPAKNSVMYGLSWEGGDYRDGKSHGGKVVKVGNQGVWRFDKDYGWHSLDPRQEGPRGPKHYQEWLNKRPSSKAPPMPPKPGTEELDTMPYLNANQEKIARRECLKIVQEEFPEFSPKKWSTFELASCARAQLRVLIPDYNDLSNRELMEIIIGEDEPAVNQS